MAQFNKKSKKKVIKDNKLYFEDINLSKFDPNPLKEDNLELIKFDFDKKNRLLYMTPSPKLSPAKKQLDNQDYNHLESISLEIIKPKKDNFKLSSDEYESISFGVHNELNSSIYYEPKDYLEKVKLTTVFKQELIDNPTNSNIENSLEVTDEFNDEITLSKKIGESEDTKTIFDMNKENNKEILNANNLEATIFYKDEQENLENKRIYINNVQNKNLNLNEKFNPNEFKSVNFDMNELTGEKPIFTEEQNISTKINYEKEQDELEKIKTIESNSEIKNEEKNKLVNNISSKFIVDDTIETIELNYDSLDFFKNSDFEGNEVENKDIFNDSNKSLNKIHDELNSNEENMKQIKKIFNFDEINFSDFNASEIEDDEATENFNLSKLKIEDETKGKDILGKVEFEDIDDIVDKIIKDQYLDDQKENIKSKFSN